MIKNENDALSQKIMSDEQAQYTEFINWFHSNSSAIDDEIWKLFFKHTDEHTLLIHKDLTSVLLKAKEINLQEISGSLQKVVNYIENELGKKILGMTLEVEKNRTVMESNGFAKEFCKITEDITHATIEMVQRSFNSVKVILAGIQLAMLGSDSFENEQLMKHFSTEIDTLLERQMHHIMLYIKKEREDQFEHLSVFPRLILE